MRWLIGAVLWLASAAWAVLPGAPLYVASPEVVVRETPSPKSKVVLTLKRGDQVKWLGVSDKDKAFHLVERDGKKGYLHLGDLTPAKPQQEVSTPPTDQPVPFAQSGAATKSPPPAPSEEDAAAMKQLQDLEALNAAAATPAALEKKRRELAGQR